MLLVSCIIVRLPTDSFALFGRVKEEGEGVEEVLIYGRFYTLFCIGRWWAKDDIMGLWVARRRGGEGYGYDGQCLPKVPRCLVTWI